MWPGSRAQSRKARNIRYALDLALLIRWPPPLRTAARRALELAVIRDGVVVGIQGIGGRDFAVLREVHTGSWLGRRYQRQGIGTQMRAAVLHLAFEGLGAKSAVSAAFEDNPASLGVSRKLGYRDGGIEWHLVRGRPALTHRPRRPPAYRGTTPTRPRTIP